MVKVIDVIANMEEALNKLKALDPNLPVYGDFEQSGYRYDYFPCKQMEFVVDHWPKNKEEGKEEAVNITAKFIEANSD